MLRTPLSLSTGGGGGGSGSLSVETVGVFLRLDFVSDDFGLGLGFAFGLDLDLDGGLDSVVFVRFLGDGLSSSSRSSSSSEGSRARLRVLEDEAGFDVFDPLALRGCAERSDVTVPLSEMLSSASASASVWAISR